MLSLEEARTRILAGITPLGAVTLPFAESDGHVLAEDVMAEEDLPPWANSAMDGYALRAADVAGAAADAPARLRVVGALPAGHAPDRPLGPGEALRIMTGAPVPEGADAVAMVEITETVDGEVRIFQPVRPGEAIRRAGENVRRGDCVLPAGTPLRAADIGLLASLGRLNVSVIRKPVVGVLSSGDELVPPGETPGPGQIRDSNRFTLCAHLRRLGFPARDYGNAPDQAPAIEARFRAAAAECDALVSTGGVSVGDHDLTRDVLGKLGRIEFWRVAIRPGKPLAFGSIEGKPAFGLPGNPVSSLVGLDQFVRPALRKMAGQTRLLRDTYAATLEAPLRRAPGRTEFIRAVITWTGQEFRARSTGPQGSGILRSMALANGFIIVSPETTELPAGARVDCQLFTEEV